MHCFFFVMRFIETKRKKFVSKIEYDFIQVGFQKVIRTSICICVVWRMSWLHEGLFLARAENDFTTLDRCYILVLIRVIIDVAIFYAKECTYSYLGRKYWLACFPLWIENFQEAIINTTYVRVQEVFSFFLARETYRLIVVKMTRYDYRCVWLKLQFCKRGCFVFRVLSISYTYYVIRQTAFSKWYRNHVDVVLGLGVRVCMCIVYCVWCMVYGTVVHRRN